MVPQVGRKTITTLQAGGVYKETWPCDPGDPWPPGSTAQTIFKDSSGADILAIDGEVSQNYITFLEQPETMQTVPNGAGFVVILTDTDGPHVVRYGTVFRRELFFPNSPAFTPTATPKRYWDDFQRPPGQLGGKWINLLGKPRIIDNPGTTPNSVGPDFVFFSRYFARYYQPFSGDSIELSISCIDKGIGDTLVALNCNSDGTSYQFARFQEGRCNLGIGHGTDIIVMNGHVEAVTEDIPISVATSGAPSNFKIRYDMATKKLGLYSDDYTEEIVSWVDEEDRVPHGKGYRYFAIAGRASILNVGVELTYISAKDVA